jgi:carbon monoxide dehydrogenase subunit G
VNGTLIDRSKIKSMNLESPTVIVEKSPEEVFNFLSDVKNFEKLMPENISKFEVIDEDKFLFALKGMPEIILKKKELVAPNKIILGAAGGKIDFSLTGLITKLEANKSEVQLVFDGEFNAMMAMMIKGPITKFIETLSSNIPNAI